MHTVYTLVKDPCAISYFSHCVEKKHLIKATWGGRVGFGSQLEEIQSMAEETSRLLEREGVGHIVYSGNRGGQRPGFSLLSPFR